nr:MAG TPA_asm: hypothetical protein [Caudoviricetes sp.]
MHRCSIPTHYRKFRVLYTCLMLAKIYINNI